MGPGPEARGPRPQLEGVWADRGFYGSLSHNVKALTVGQIIDSLAVRVDGPKAWSLRIVMDWRIGADHWHLRLADGLLTWTQEAGPPPTRA